MSVHSYQIAILIFLPSLGWGAIAFDAAASEQSSTLVSNVSWNHTCTGNNLILTVGCTAAARTTTGVTYNSVSMTKINSIVYTAGGTEVSLFYLLNPSTGTNTTTATFSGSTAGTSCGSVSLTGVIQTTGSYVTAASSGASITSSISLTTIVDNDWMLDVVGDANAGDSINVPSGQTLRWIENGVNIDGAGSTLGPISPPALSTTTWNFTSSSSNPPWGMCAMSFSPTSIITNGDDPNLLLMKGTD